MTKHFRTLVLLAFTGLAASLAGCIVETRDSGRNTCLDDQYFQVYWSVDDAAGPLTCNQAPPSHVELVTNTGITYPVGKECAATSYMGFVFDFRGSTNNVPAGTYVVTANLVSDTIAGQVLSTTGPTGTAQYAIPACNSVILAFPFGL